MPDDTPLTVGTGRIVVTNEFASVTVEVRGSSGRARLSIEDLRTGALIELDALELESLAWAAHADLAGLLDPNRTRWRSSPDPVATCRRGLESATTTAQT